MQHFVNFQFAMSHDVNFHLLRIWEGFSWLPIIGILVFYTGFACGVGQVTIFISGEILPANARGMGSGMVSVISGLLKFAATAGVPVLQETIGTGSIPYLGHECVKVEIIEYLVNANL